MFEFISSYFPADLFEEVYNIFMGLYPNSTQLKNSITMHVGSFNVRKEME